MHDESVQGGNERVRGTHVELELSSAAGMKLFIVYDQMPNETPKPFGQLICNPFESTTKIVAIV